MHGLIAAEPRVFGLMSHLADATRSRVLLLLEQHELNVSELCTVLQMPQSTVSRHLRVLLDDGWLAAHAEGTSRRYRMLADRLEAPAQGLWLLVRSHVGELPAAAQDAARVGSVLASRRSRSEEFFASTAGEWDRIRTDMFGARIDLLAVLGLLDSSWTVGDLGCGTGGIAEAVAPWVERVIAVDGSPEMLHAAEERLRRLDHRNRVDLRRGALEELPIDGDTLDAAILFLVLHYVSDPQAVIAEAARALKPGGRLLIADMTPHDRLSYRNEMGHAWLGFSSEQIGEWLVGAGFVGTRYHALAPDPDASGPAVFTVAARLAEPVL